MKDNRVRSIQDLTKIANWVTIFAFLLICSFSSKAQNSKLKPGFDKEEYLELLRMHVLLYDSTKADTSKPKSVITKPTHFTNVYNSAVVGLDNKWGLWINKTHPIAVLNVRGTTLNPVGWLENFYAAMVPAKGEVKLTNAYTFQYHLADNPKAAVHIGWLIGTAFLARDIIPKIDSCYKAGIKEFLIMGHSQGGAITFLLTSHFYQLQKDKKLPADIRFKTYASASPKAGNTYYAYEYESLIDGGWGYNVVNAADWVPELPFSVQTLDDFNETNPFKNIEPVIKKQKLLTRVALKHAYKQMKKPSEKAQRNYQKYLGNYASKTIIKQLPEFQPPVYFKSNNYVRIGPTIALIPNAEYYKRFPDSEKQIFIHHLPDPYLYLIQKYKY
ncbi:lipase family protein [Dyadobacter chenwenxiniae]|uniref:Lipase family protein n=1 Tax=Dyadobacter chenwenxiniae TaxID=2906456 RepID=A0A9X1PJR3_9BACT|nr:lipase family protein [Dyadobacter chenwenxiniae]MCF0060798.1 lipase family protein [Dyadobacter chenwenxiniae]UON80630.1 lipase family protein [Dyadobacter chenwenxiniae]